MKKSVFLVFSILLCLSVSAQNNPRNIGVLNVFSQKELFYLYINGVQYNTKPTNKIRIESIPKNSFKVQVEFEHSSGNNSSVLSPVNVYNELGEALEVSLLATFSRSGVKDLIIYSYHPVRMTLPDMNSFMVFDYNKPNDQLYDGLKPNKPFLYDNQMPPQEFSAFLDRLNKEGFDKDRMRIVPLTTSGYIFSVDQIGQAMQKFDWDDGKVKFAEFMYPKCYDRGSYLNLLSKLTFISAQNQLRDFIKKQSNASYFIQRMDVKAFDNFMHGLKRQSFDQDKLDYISAVSSSTSFSVAQIKAILKAFSFDDRRLDAAKILMENCSDKQSYYTLTDAFTFHSSKDAFLNFIKR